MCQQGKRRISVGFAACAAALVLGGFQLQASAHGAEVTAAATATATEREPAPVPAFHEGDHGSSHSDGNVFVDGVMTLEGHPAAEHTAQSGNAALAAPAPQPPSGEGWKSGGPGKWVATGYTIKFYDQKSADWLGGYVKASAADLQRITNLPVKVDTEPVGWDYVRPKGEIVLAVLHRPCKLPPAGSNEPWKIVRDGSGDPYWSCGFYSSSLPDTATSGHAYINDQFFTADGKATAAMTEAGLRNHIAHELGHTFGFTHADRSATRGDCVTGTDAGQSPVMCSVVTAYTDKRAGTYVQQFDAQGMRTLAANTGLKPPPQGRVGGVGGMCLDVKSGKSANGTALQLWTCNGTAAQSWVLGADGTFRVFGKCLDNAGNVTANGNKIQLYDCNGTAAQKWSVNAKGQIVHVASGKVLDAANGSSAKGTVIQLYTANTGKGQLWTVPK
ncbi:ricin-type beta-trefoil lectin domain protein [Streptomyces subrutilus]|uniref:ricin-type beta-trefoil lectin domain protein n=1 Tax=Streptomyces subrutilus TaxID=36818 RepID=UPI0033E3DB1B